MCEAHARATRSTRSSTIFEESLARGARGTRSWDGGRAGSRRHEPSGAPADRQRHQRHPGSDPPARRHRKRGTTDRWSSTVTQSARSTGRRPCSSRSANSTGEAGVTELARRLGLHKSTASRLLATLQKRGLVEQDDETGKYRLGLVIIRLAERAERTLDLRGIAMPELERLARLTHETTGPRHPRRRHAPDRRPGRRPEPDRGRGLDRSGDAAPLRRVRQGPDVVGRRARGPPDRPARPRQLHGTDHHRARAAPRGAGPDPAARLRHRARRVRDGPERGRGAGPRRPRQRDRRRRHLGPGLPAHARDGSRSSPPRRARPRPRSRSVSAAPGPRRPPSRRWPRPCRTRRSPRASRRRSRRPRFRHRSSTSCRPRSPPRPEPVRRPAPVPAPSRCRTVSCPASASDQEPSPPARYHQA